MLPHGYKNHQLYYEILFSRLRTIRVYAVLIAQDFLKLTTLTRTEILASEMKGIFDRYIER